MNQSAKRTKRFVVALPAIIKSYNSSYHSSIGMAPNIVTVDYQDQIWTRLYGDGDTYLKRHRKVENGAKVRINRVKGVFDQGYMPNWSREQFTLSSKNQPADTKVRNSPPVYTLKDDSNEELRGKWYRDKIQQIHDKDNEFERVLKRRTAADGTRELFVMQRDYPAKYNSWISEQDLSM